MALNSTVNVIRRRKKEELRIQEQNYMSEPDETSHSEKQWTKSEFIFILGRNRAEYWQFERYDSEMIWSRV